MFSLPVLALVLSLVSQILNAEHRVVRMKKVLSAHLDIPLERPIHEQFSFLKSIHEDDIADCFHPHVDSEHIDIFNLTMGGVVEKFFTHVHANEEDQLGDRERLDAFVGNLQELSEMIHDCSKLKKEERTLLGVTSMSALTQDEYEAFLNYELDNEPLSNPRRSCNFMYKKPKPDILDYRTSGKVSRVKNQGKCGSCYIFAGLSALESAYMLNTEAKNLTFSEQALLNCVPNGCKGGTAFSVWNFAMRNGVPKESQYPYKGKVGKCVRYPASGQVWNYCYNIGNLQDEQMRAILVKNGPFYGALDASNPAFKHLKGIFNGNCRVKPNHAITVIGYDQQKWIIKNSWGRKWGANGFFYLPRNQNKCGINRHLGVPFIH